MIAVGYCVGGERVCNRCTHSFRTFGFLSNSGILLFTLSSLFPLLFLIESLKLVVLILEIALIVGLWVVFSTPGVFLYGSGGPSYWWGRFAFATSFCCI